MYSLLTWCQVFLGGVPWDITEKCLQAAFRHFGPVRIEWPGRGRAAEGGSAPKGYLYVILEGEGAVAALLAQCTHDYSGEGAWYYRWALREASLLDPPVAGSPLVARGPKTCRSSPGSSATPTS